MVLNIDVAPTLTELAGSEVSADMQGTSVVPLLKNENKGWRTSIMYEYFQEEYAPGFVTVVGVRNGRYKYIESLNVPGDINELYDLQTDPGEMNNLINSPGHQAIKNEMIKELQNNEVDLFINVNNHFEGSAPLTIEKITSKICLTS